MQTLQQLPDLASSFQKLKLQDLIAENTHPALFAQVCQAGAYENFGEVVKMIKEQLRDNRALVIEMMGKQVVTIIEQLS